MIARRTRDVAELNETGARGPARRGPRRGSGARWSPSSEFASAIAIITRVNTPQVSNRERWEVIAVDREAGSASSLQRIGGDERSRHPRLPTT